MDTSGGRPGTVMVNPPKTPHSDATSTEKSVAKQPGLLARTGASVLGVVAIGTVLALAGIYLVRRNGRNSH